MIEHYVARYPVIYRSVVLLLPSHPSVSVPASIWPLVTTQLNIMQWLSVDISNLNVDFYCNIITLQIFILCVVRCE